MLRPKDFNGNYNTRNDVEEEEDDDDNDDGENFDVYECGVAGCNKHFMHEHIGIDGKGRDADTLGF